MSLHQEPQLRWGLRSGAKAPGGQPLHVTSTKGRAGITAPDSRLSLQQRLTAPERNDSTGHWFSFASGGFDAVLSSPAGSKPDPSLASSQLITAATLQNRALDGTASVGARYNGSPPGRKLPMFRIAIVVATAAAALTTAPLATPAKAEGVKMAQVDVQIGRDRDRDRYRSDRDRDTTVGVGPGGVTVGPRQRCRTVTTRVESDDGRMVTRKERRCD
jgi:hypothetical protein